MMLDAQALADRYVAAWNERDADRRRDALAALWAPDAQRLARARGFGGLGKLMLGASETNGGRDGIRFRAAPGARDLKRTAAETAFVFAPPRAPASGATS